MPMDGRRRRGAAGRAAGRLVRAALAAAVFAAAGCAHLPGPETGPPPEAERDAATPEALALLEGLRRANDPLRSFKGIGRLTVRQGGRLQLDGRIAWVGEDPRRLSIVLTAAGFPALRMATDGEFLYVQDPQDPANPVQRYRTADPDLKRLLAIPIRVGEIVTLLCGRVPLAEHRAVRLDPAHPGGGGRVLALSEAGRPRQRIHFDADRDTARFTELYDSGGGLRYRADFVEMQRVGPYRVPQRLTVLNGEGTEALLVVENYWADVPVSPAMFVLQPPG
jgi:hypothetical protein